MSSIQLNWNAVTPAGSTYTVLRNGSTLATALAATSYLDTTAADNTAYTYVVFATNQNGPGLSSNTAAATTPPAQVTGLTATPASSSQINLSWTATPGATSYTVRRGGSTVGSPAGTTFPDTGLTASTNYTYTVAANGAGGQGAQSAPASATTQASGAKNFTPGHGFSLFNYNDTVANQLSYIAALNNPASTQYDPNHYITFVLLYARWNVLENTLGDYTFGGSTTQGFGLIDRYVNACAAVGRVFCLAVAYQQFANALPQSNAHSCLPAYLDGIANGPYVNTTTTPWSGTLVINAQLDTTAGMDRAIALSQNYAGRYNNNPAFEMFVMGETSCGVPSGFNGFSGANYDNQMSQRGEPAFGSHWTRSQWRTEYNYTNSGGSAAMPAMFIAALANKGTSGGPDIFSTGYDAGIDWGLGTRIGNFGGVDYRTTMLHMSEQQERHINAAGYTASLAYNNALGGYPVSKANYYCWERQNYGTAMTWDGVSGTNSIRAFILSGAAPVNTTRPAGY